MTEVAWMWAPFFVRGTQEGRTCVLMNLRFLKGSKMGTSAGLWGSSGTEAAPGWRPRFRRHKSGGGDQRWNSGDRPEAASGLEGKLLGPHLGTVMRKGLRAQRGETAWRRGWGAVGATAAG